MGNQSAKETGQKLFTADELKVLESAYRAANGGNPEKLLKYWSTIIDPHLAKCTVSFLTTASARQRLVAISVLRFGEPYYIVERGTIDEKLNFLAGSMDKSDSNQFAIKELEHYVTSVVKSYLKLKADEGSVAFDSFANHGFISTERSIFGFAKGLIRALSQDAEEHNVALNILDRWLQMNPTFLTIWRKVFSFLYNKCAYGTKQRLGGSGDISTNILPYNEGIPSGANYTPILDLPHVIFINSHLPNALRRKWRFLFSSKIMGESFSTMLGKIQNKGATLIVIEDEDRYIFGGFAPESWSLGPAFTGDDSSMLFTLSPAMRCFNATGYNNHYQYLNLNQQTMPNGLGMGGQFNYWGLWLDCEYGMGQSSESCTTYRDYAQLSKRKDFRIRNLEVWGVGDEPKLSDDSDGEDGKTKRSILDHNLEDRVMMELAGKEMHSEGLREPDMDL